MPGSHRFRIRRPTRAIAMAIGVGLCLWAATATGQSASDKAAARELAVSGVKLASAGRCKEAIPKLKRAEALFHAPTILTPLAECQIKLGRLVAGTENLQRVTREKLAPDAPKPYLNAQARARALLEQTLPRIARLRIEVIATDDAKLEIRLDGVRLPRAVVGVDRPTDPGHHTVSVRAPGFLKATAQVSLGEASRKTLELSLVPDPNAAPERSGAPSSKRGPQDTGTVATTNKTLPYILLAGGGALVVGGSVLGYVALKKRNDLNNSCPNKVCTSSGDLDNTRSLANLSTIALGVGIASAAAGGYLLWKQSSAPGKTSRTTHRGARVEAWVGVGAAGVRGKF